MFSPPDDSSAVDRSPDSLDSQLPDRQVEYFTYVSAGVKIRRRDEAEITRAEFYANWKRHDELGDPVNQITSRFILAWSLGLIYGILFASR